MDIPFKTAVVLSNMFVFSSLGIYLNYRSEILFGGLRLTGPDATLVLNNRDFTRIVTGPSYLNVISALISA
jgi:hypothetical protein